MLKQTTTPNHAVTTMKDQTVEAITTADANYVRAAGVWRKSPISPETMLAMKQENIRNTSVASCAALPDEVVDGTPTMVYHAHYEQPGSGVTDAKVWIAKATGLPVRADTNTHAGQATSSSTRYDYKNIVAPVVK